MKESKNRRRRRFRHRILVLWALVALLGMGSAGGAHSYPVEVNGEHIRLRGEGTVADALRLAGVRVRPGPLVAVDGSVLAEAMHPPRIWVDGVRATTSSPVWPGARIRAVDGPALTEDIEVADFEVTERWWGPEWYLSEPPVPGRATGRRGLLSGTLVRDAIEAPPVMPKPRTGAPEVALTFDDGPGRHTEQILDILVSRGLHATFFVVGDNVRRNPETTRRLVAAGMGIGNHTWSHPADIMHLDSTEIIEQIVDTEEMLFEVTGRRTTLFRPPGGFLTEALQEAVGWTGHRVIMWTIDTHDFRQPPPQEIVARVVSRLQHGAIILMHDGGGDRSSTVAALPHLLDALAGAGYHVVPLPS